ncbi:MAG: T9SS type A sorting domain-containing protein [Ignavibacteriaceae bacterium]|nr:T9SS type A sorting domain-containing protein [Ignavibacteriaceae bacterium]
MKISFIILFSIIPISLVLTQTEPIDTDSDGKREVSTLSHLQWISQNSSGWSYSYEQTADIDASETSQWGGGGFSSIGNYSVKFTGSYDGQGFKISYLYIDRDTDYNGFFGILQGATISNLQTYHVQFHGGDGTGGLFGQAMSSTITNCSSTFYVNGRHSTTGGLGGYANNTTISGCYFIGEVYGGTVTSGIQNYTGGLIGEFSNSSSMTNCYFSGSVSGHDLTGGLIGTCNSSSVSKCFSKGSVMGNDRTGGLIGHLNNNIDNCYSRSSVSVNVTGNEVGGLIGGIWDNTITNCYSTGTVTGVSYVGGLVGYNYSTPNMSGCFWDTEASSCTTSASGTGKTTAEMKTQSTFTDAGYSTSIWNMDTYNDGYPYLDWENPGGSPLPVELTSFTATTNGNSVLLKWETATEVDNYGFEIERVKSEELKVKNFTTLGFIQGTGNSNSPKAYSFMDNDLENGTYLYRLKQLNTDGSFDYSNEISAMVSFIPDKFLLMQNYPNPFNGETIIKFQLPADGFVSLRVYDLLGNEAAILVNDYQRAGEHSVKYSASTMASGIYYYELRTEKENIVRKLVLLR